MEAYCNHLVIGGETEQPSGDDGGPEDGQPTPSGAAQPAGLRLPGRPSMGRHRL